jgi:hypothetical protein
VDGLSAVEHGVPNPGLSSRGDGRDLALVHYALGVVGNASPRRKGGKICEKRLDRDGMRVRAAAGGYNTAAVAD